MEDSYKAQIDECVQGMSREEKIAFLLAGEKEIHIPYTKKHGDFSTTSEDDINEMVFELDAIWK